MKTGYIRLAAGLATVTGLAMAPSNAAVGYVKITVSSGESPELYLVAHQFLQIDGTDNTIAVILGGQLPDLTQIFTWNGAGYNAPSTYFNGTFVPPGTGDTVIHPADGFWIQVPPNTPSTEIFLTGEVPGSGNGFDSNVVHNLTGLQLLSNPYPVTRPWTDMDLAEQLPNLSQLFLYDGGFGVLSTKSRIGTWTSDPEISAGEAFFISIGANGTGTLAEWVETKPYSFP